MTKVTERNGQIRSSVYSIFHESECEGLVKYKSRMIPRDLLEQPNEWGKKIWHKLGISFWPFIWNTRYPHEKDK